MATIPTAQPSKTAPPFSIPSYLADLGSAWWLAQDNTAWLAGNLQLCQDVLNCANSFDSSLDLSQAVGVQLDELGVILGQSRTVSFQPSDSVSPVLTDSVYRLLLQATVLRNHWNGLLVSLRGIWNQLFPSGILLWTDNQNMTVNFYVAAPLSSIQQDLIANDLIIPRPQGVLYTFSFAALPLVGYDEATADIAGWATFVVATTGDTTMGSFTATVTSATGIVNGQTVVGPGIPANTTITISGTTLTLSNEATATQTGVTLAFFTTDLSGHYA
jgi:Protein of unknown function (DUF2612)